MSLNKESIRDLIEIVKELYKKDDIPWVIGYSGGKDSTASLQLVWLALLEMEKEDRDKKNVHVISTDTMVESPIISGWVNESLQKMDQQAKIDDLPIFAHKLTPNVSDTFWVNLLGRGYPYPRQNFRWCTDRLKIKPANRFVKEMVSIFGEIILVLGTRRSESLARARSMDRNDKNRVNDFLSRNESMQNELVFSPISEWSNDDVWMFLMQYKNPWKHSNKDLLTLYRGATEDGECPMVVDTNTPSCGSSRFGCWVCTLVEKDKSMAAMITNDKEKKWLTPLLEFRNEIGDPKRDKSRRDFRRMTGKVHIYNGGLVHGPYVKSVREEWLRKLLSIQKWINNHGPEEFEDLELITLEELHFIRKIWLDEKHEFDDSLPDIVESVMGEDFFEMDLRRPDSNSFGKLEYKILSKICQERYPNEKLLTEMVSRIIDVENKYSDINKRSGVLKDIEKAIKMCFYSDEKDALNYEKEKAARKSYINQDAEIYKGTLYDKEENYYED